MPILTFQFSSLKFSLILWDFEIFFFTVYLCIIMLLYIFSVLSIMFTLQNSAVVGEAILYVSFGPYTLA